MVHGPGSTTAGDDVLRRVARDTALAVVVGAVLLLVWRPDQPRLAGGVVGGGVLLATAWWAIGGMVRAAVRDAETRENRRVLRALPLVKFFTRHVILALAAYGMMARLQLHPVGLLVGVSAVLVGATMEAARGQHKFKVQSSKFKVSGKATSHQVKKPEGF
jgi:hypothetical protein